MFNNPRVCVIMLSWWDQTLSLPLTLDIERNFEMPAKQDINFFAWRLWKLLTDVPEYPEKTSHAPSLNHIYLPSYILP